MLAPSSPRIALLFSLLLLAPALAPWASAQPPLPQSAIQVSGIQDLGPNSGVTGTGSEASPWTWSGFKLDANNSTAISISNLDGYVVLKDLNLSGTGLISVTNVTHVRVENIRGNSSGDGLQFVNVSELTVTDVRVRALGNGFVADHVKKGKLTGIDARDVLTGIVLNEFDGTLVYANLTVRDSGLVGGGVRGFVQGVNVLGTCAGVGLELGGGAPQLIGNAAQCQRLGIGVTAAPTTSLEGNAVFGSEVGISITAVGAYSMKGDVVKSATTTGIVVSGGTGSISTAKVTGTPTGILLSGTTSALSGVTVEDSSEVGIDAQGTTLSDVGSKVSGSRIGMRVTGGTATLSGTSFDADERGLLAVSSAIPGASITAKNLWGDAIGAEMRGSTDGGVAWVSHNVVNSKTALLLDGMSDVTVTTLTVDDSDWAADVKGKSKLTVAGGSTGPFERGGFRATDASALNLKGFVSGPLTNHFVEANDSEVLALNLAITAVAKEAFMLRRSELSLRDSSITSSLVGIRMEGLPAPFKADPSNASTLSGVTIDKSMVSGVELRGAALEIIGGRISNSLAYGIDARDDAMLVAHADLLVDHSGNDGIHWIVDKTIPSSTLFQDSTLRKKIAPHPQLRDVRLDANGGSGAYFQDFSKMFGLTVEKVRATRNVEAGLWFASANALITQATIEQNVGHGIRSVWLSPLQEQFVVQDSSVSQNGGNGIYLDDHSSGTTITRNEVHKQGDGRLGHAAVGHGIRLADGSIDEGLQLRRTSNPGAGGAPNPFPMTRERTNQTPYARVHPEDDGPLVRANKLSDNPNCNLETVGSNARFIENAIASAKEFDEGCAVFVRNSKSFAIVGNDFVGTRNGIEIEDNSKGRIVANNLTKTTGTALSITGDGTSDVTVTHNTIDHFNGGGVFWQNAKGVLDHNDFKNSVSISTGLSPEITNNKFVDYELYLATEARTYDGVNRIRGNVFSNAAVPLTKDSFAQAIVDNGHDQGSQGANVQGNTFTQGIYVRCHRTDEGDILLNPKCAEGGHLYVDSHDFGGAAAGTAGRDGTAPAYGEYPYRTIERTTPHFTTIARGTRTECRGIWLEEPTIEVTRLQGKEFQLTGTARWHIEGPSDGPLCDDPNNITISFKTGADTLETGKKSIRHIFKSEGLHTVSFVVEITSVPFGLQNRVAVDRAWSASIPYLGGIKSDRGNVFLAGVGIPGGVRWTADVIWPGAPGYVDFKWGVHEARGYGMHPSFVNSPERDFFASVTGVSQFPITGQAFDPTGQAKSAIASARVKIIPIPAAMLAYAAPGEVKAKFVDDPAGKGKIRYEFEMKVIDGIKQKITTDQLGPDQKYEFSFDPLIIRARLDSTGPGSLGAKSKLGFTGQSPRFEWNMQGSVEVGGEAIVDAVEFKNVYIQGKAEGDFLVYILPSDLFPSLKAASAIPIVGAFPAQIDRSLRAGLGFGILLETTVRADSVESGGNAPFLPGWKISGEQKVAPRVTVKVIGKISDDLKATLYGRATIAFIFVSPSSVDKSLIGYKQTELEGELGAELKAYAWEKKYKIVFVTVFHSPGEGFKLSEETDWKIPERDWTNGGELSAAGDRVLASLTRDASPAYAWARDASAMAVFVKDDTTKPYPRSGEIAAVIQDPATLSWRSLPPITNDDLMDSIPSVAALAGDAFVAAWTRNLDATLSTSTPLGAGAVQQFETAISVYLPEKGAFGAPSIVTSDKLPDHGAQALSGPDGSALVVWSKNPGGLLFPDAASPDELWSARIARDGTIGQATRALTGLASASRAYTWDGTRLHVAVRLDDGSIKLHSVIPGGSPQTTTLAGGPGAPPTLALLGNATQKHVAYLRANGSVFDLVETDVPGATRIVAPDAGPSELWYSSGETRALAWTQPRGEGSVALEAVLEDGAYGLVREAATSSGILRLVAASENGVAVEDRALVNGTRHVEYSGANAENEVGAPPTVKISRDVNTTTPGAATLRAVGPPPPARGPLAGEVHAESVHATPDEKGQVHLVSAVRNDGTTPSDAREAWFVISPSGTHEGTRIAVRIPPIPANATALVAASAPLPSGAKGLWVARLDGADVDTGATGMLRLDPEWRLSGYDVSLVNGVASFRLRNEGATAGSTEVRAYEMLPNGSWGAALGSARVSAPAFGSVSGSITLSRAATLVALLADPDLAVDQADHSGSVAIARPGAALSLTGIQDGATVKSGPFSFEVDAGGFTLVEASLDATPLEATSNGGKLSVRGVVGPGAHLVRVAVVDDEGIVRGTSLTLRGEGELPTATTNPTGSTPTTTATPTPAGKGSPLGAWVIVAAAVAAALVARKRR